MADSPILNIIGASGLDTGAIVDALANARRSPILRLQAQVAKLQRQSTEFGTLASRLTALRTKAGSIDTAAELRAFAGSSSDPTAVAVSVTNPGAEGTYAITVNALAQAASQLGTGVAQRTGLAIGSGTISITSGGTKYDIAIAANSDLEAIRDAINASEVPVTAAIIDDGSGVNPHKLVLTSDATGAASAFSVNLAGFTSQVGSFGFTTLAAGQDASFTFNGATVTRASNTVTDLIDGVRLSLLKANGSSATVSVSKDRETVKARIKDFIAAFNDITDLVRTHSNSAAKDTTAVLYGDSTLSSAQATIRRVIDSEVATGSAYGTLASIGVKTGSDGKLSVDETKLANALNADFDGVIALFTQAGTGIANRIQTDTSSFQSAAITTRTTGIQRRIKFLNDQADQLERRLDKYIEDLRKKFSDLDALAGRLQAQASALSSIGR